MIIMNKDDIISFFDSHADSWDEFQERNEQVIEEILDKGGIRKGVNVLDVACGTGILFPDYLKREVASVTGIDISPEMVKKAKSKFSDSEVICADAETVTFDKQFDIVMIYNAFPHFINPHKLIGNLAKVVKHGGRLTIAHGMSKEELDKFHMKNAGIISNLLPEKEETATILSPFFDVDVMISDDRMYIVSGTKK